MEYQRFFPKCNHFELCIKVAFSDFSMQYIVQHQKNIFIWQNIVPLKGNKRVTQYE